MTQEVSMEASTRLSAAPDLAKLTEPPLLSGRTNPYVRMASSHETLVHES